MHFLIDTNILIYRLNLGSRFSRNFIKMFACIKFRPRCGRNKFRHAARHALPGREKPIPGGRKQ